MAPVDSCSAGCECCLRPPDALPRGSPIVLATMSWIIKLTSCGAVCTLEAELGTAACYVSDAYAWWAQVVRTQWFDAHSVC